MPRAKIDLDPYKDEILALIALKKTNAEIIRYLHDSYQTQLADHTLRRRLKEWNISIRKWTQDTPALRDRITSLFFNGLNDDQLYRALQTEGYQLGARALPRLRYELGLKHSLRTAEGQQEAEETAAGVITEELQKGVIEGYGRGLLYAHFQQLGVNIARYVYLYEFGCTMYSQI